MQKYAHAQLNRQVHSVSSVMETKLARPKTKRKITSSGDPLSGVSRLSSNRMPEHAMVVASSPMGCYCYYRNIAQNSSLTNTCPAIALGAQHVQGHTPPLTAMRSEWLCLLYSGNKPQSDWLGCPSLSSKTKDNRGDLWMASPPIRPVYRQASDPMRTWIMCWDSVKVQWEHCVRDSFYSRPEQSQTTCPIVKLFG